MTLRIRGVIVFAILIFLPLSGTLESASGKTSKPTLAQIEAAKRAEDLKRSNANAANGKLLEAKKTLIQLGAIARETQQEFVIAKAKLVKSAKRAELVAKYANDASAVVTATHREIGKLAINALIDGGGFTNFEAVLSSNGPQDLMVRLSTLNNLGKGNAQALLRFKSAETAARAAQQLADAAKRDQAAATFRVALTKKLAEAAHAQQQDEVDRLQAVQDQLLKEQATVGMLRAERKEQEELAGRKKIEAARTKALRTSHEKENDVGVHPPRIARVGKPLKRRS